MKYLSHRAAKDVLWSIRACYSIGLASRTETLDRMLALRQMCSLTNPARGIVLATALYVAALVAWI